jgi:very-short-patch-repair endonuclease
MPNKGFKVLRFWESEIKVMEITDFESKLRSMIENGK